MVARVWSLMRFLIKGSVAGGAVYLVYDQELLGPSDKSEAALRKAEEVVPPAMYQFSQYVCQQTGLEMPQLPAPPKINFPNFRDSWNSEHPGTQWTDGGDFGWLNTTDFSRFSGLHRAPGIGLTAVTLLKSRAGDTCLTL